MRAGERERRRFSEILAQDLGDPRLRAMMSMRADFFGDLQKDEPLYSVHRLINVPPLREAQLREVVSRPAALLSARFENSWPCGVHRPAGGGGIDKRLRRHVDRQQWRLDHGGRSEFRIAPNTMTVRGRMSRPNFLAAAA